MVGTLPGTDAFFRSGRSGGIEAHFGVGGPWEGASYDGAVWQWRGTDEQADANYKANAFAVSIETSDGGDPSRPWTPKQVDALVDLGRWLADIHLIPRRICPAWDKGGYGWHAMWGAPSPWTPATGKTCPGSVRIAQLKATVLPAIFADQEADMYDADAEARLFKRIEEAERRTARYVDHGEVDTAGSSNHHAKVLAELAAFRAAVGARLDAIEDLLTPEPPA